MNFENGVNPFDNFSLVLPEDNSNGESEPHEEEKRHALVPANEIPSDFLVDLSQLHSEDNAPAETLSEEEIEKFIKRRAWALSWQYYREFWPADGSFTLSENLIVLYSTGIWDWNASPIFTDNEMLFAYAYFNIVYGGYYLIQHLRHGEPFGLASLWSANKFANQFWLFYFLDRDFDIDGDSWEERIPNIVIVGFIMALGAYLMDIVPGILWAFCHPENDENEEKSHCCVQTKKIMIRKAGEAAAVAFGTDVWAVPYYIPIDGFFGMVIKGFLEGQAADLAVLPLVYRSYYWDIQDDVKRGDLIPKTLQQEQEEEKLRIEEEKRHPRPSFSSRVTNYFGHWIFGKNEVAENKVPFLTQEEKEAAYEADTEQALPLPKKKSGSKSKHRSSSKSKRKGNDDEFDVVELRISSSGKKY